MLIYNAIIYINLTHKSMQNLYFFIFTNDDTLTFLTLNARTCMINCFLFFFLLKILRKQVKGRKPAIIILYIFFISEFLEEQYCYS